MRLFVAVEGSASWRTAVDVLREEIATRCATAGVDERALRWVDPALLHLTVRFLGEVDDGRTPALIAALAEHVRACDLTLTAAAVDRAVAACGLVPARRALRPHVTLAQVRAAADARARTAIAQAAHAASAPDLPPLRVRHLALVRSHLSRRGAAPPRYEVLARVPTVL